MGIQGHSMKGIRRMREWVEAGVLGDHVPVPGPGQPAAGKAELVRGFCAPLPPELATAGELPSNEGGSLIKGSKGSILAGVYGDGARLLPRELKEAANAFVAPAYREGWTL